MSTPQTQALQALNQARLRTWSTPQIVQLCDLTTYPGLTPQKLLTLSNHDLIRIYAIIP